MQTPIVQQKKKILINCLICYILFHLRQHTNTIAITPKSPLFFINRILSCQTIKLLILELQRFLQGCFQDKRSLQTSQQLSDAAANQVMFQGPPEIEVTAIQSLEFLSESKRSFQSSKDCKEQVIQNLYCKKIHFRFQFCISSLFLLRNR